MKLSTIAAATASITLVYASRYQTEDFVLFGAQDSTGNYPNYTQGLVVGAFPYTITNPMVVYSIEATTQPYYDCYFVGADGTNTTLGPVAVVNPPQAQVSVHCESQFS